MVPPTGYHPCHCEQGGVAGHPAHVAEFVPMVDCEARGRAFSDGRSLEGLVGDLLHSLGARLTPSPLPIADAMFGAPGWFVPVTIATAAGVGIAALYATGRLGRSVRKRRIKRRR